MTKIKPGNFCPLIQKKCIELKCAWFTQMRGTNPNTGEPVDEWSCAVTWMPIMAVEIAQKSNQTGAAVESFRNEVIKANKENQDLYLRSIQEKIIPAQIRPINIPINYIEEGKE